MFSFIHFKSQIRPFWKRNLTTSSSAKLIASAILVRTPVILPDPTPFEDAYDVYEAELSYSRTKRFIPYLKLEGKDISQAELDRQSEELLEQSPLASRVAPPEVECNFHSHNRRLDSYLYLIVKQFDQWKFPETEHISDSPLHETAIHHLKEACGSQLEVFFPARSPCTYRHRDDTIPSKIFFFRGLFVQGSISPDKKHISDYAWVDRHELKDRLTTEDFDCIKATLFY